MNGLEEGSINEMSYDAKGLQFHVAQVVDINDPDQNGRAKIRVKGLHDDKTNIPDSDLPWGVPILASDNPAVNKIGTSGNGLLVNSHVLIAYWDAGNGQQMPFIVGSIGSSGVPTSNSTTNSSTTIDKTKGDSPAPSRGTDTNAVQPNPIKNANTTPGSQKDSDGVNVHDKVRGQAKHAAEPTIATQQALGALGNVLQLIKQVDPGNKGGSIPSAVSSMSTVQSINSTISPSGIVQNAGKSLGIALNTLGTIYTSNAITTTISAITSNTNPENIVDGSYVFSTDPNVIEVLQYAMLEMTANDTLQSIANTSDNTMIVVSLSANVAYNDLKTIYDSSRTISKTQLVYEIYEMLAFTQLTGEKQQMGSGSQNAGMNAASLLPIFGQLISNTISTFLPNSVVNQSSITESLNKFTKNHALLNQKQTALIQMFSGQAGSVLSGQLSSAMKSAGLNMTNPLTGQ